MSQTAELAAELDVAPDTIEATLNYIVDDGNKVFTIVATPGGSDTRAGGTPDPRRVEIHNGRPHVKEFDLETNGFRFVGHDTKVKDFYDEDEIKRVYYPEMVELIKAESGAKRVVVFDHTLRDGNPERNDGVREPVKYIHNDQTFVSGPRRVRDHLPTGEAERLLQGRVAIVNLWRPIRETVQSSPLALCDSRSITLNDLVASDLVYPDKVGETYALVFNPRHRWYYFPHMSPDEFLLLKIYDSAGDGIARLTAHTAFDDPTSPADAPPRRSIELRTLLFF